MFTIDAGAPGADGDLIQHLTDSPHVLMSVFMSASVTSCHGDQAGLGLPRTTVRNMRDASTPASLERRR